MSLQGGLQVCLLIKGGTVIDPSRGVNGRYDLLVRHGLIAELSPLIDAGDAVVIEAAGRLVIPGLFDMHTHLREPGQEYKETVESGSRAAAAGGYTSITALPNTNPVMDSSLIIRQVSVSANRAGLVRVWPVGAVSKNSMGLELADIGAMKEAGAIAVTDDGRGVADTGLLREAMVCCRQLDIPLLQHCEVEILSGVGQIHQGAVSARLGLPGIPAASETEMLGRDLRLAAETGARLHIMHVSTARSVEMIRRARADGVRVTSEVTPHHLLLTDTVVPKLGSMAKMKPPLRSAPDMEALREGLRDGTIDAVATDHAPHAEDEKSGDFTSAPFGIVGLETAFPLLYTYLVKPGLIPLELLVQNMSYAPAAILGLPHGNLAPGSAADLAIIDISEKRVIDRHKFFSKGKNTPFHGWEVYGIPVLTMVQGKIIMRDGRITAHSEGNI
jgi:dihydroorotase